jgi:uncharacterized protein YlxW (UPF0749 family)
LLLLSITAGTFQTRNRKSRRERRSRIMTHLKSKEQIKYKIWELTQNIREYQKFLNDPYTERHPQARHVVRMASFTARREVRKLRAERHEIIRLRKAGEAYAEETKDTQTA